MTWWMERAVLGPHSPWEGTADGAEDTHSRKGLLTGARRTQRTSRPWVLVSLGGCTEGTGVAQDGRAQLPHPAALKG